ncbi:DDB1- and CUL4-associated factor homolog 1-like [Triticum urartu]|uniref:DDB1- and CUL4-associated factor homolog 1-like n=1 Tax=Triticum urartu TaxID=4572 RepID=UPI002044B56F|nr:DDB1- and CUL4-associated factor homolog 1-like [Triticum urartu]
MDEKGREAQPTVFGPCQGPAQTTERVDPAPMATGRPPASGLLPFKPTKIHRSPEIDGTSRGIITLPMEAVVKMRGRFAYAFTDFVKGCRARSSFVLKTFSALIRVRSNTRRVRLPLFPAFRTIDAVTYANIATFQIDRDVLDLATEPNDSLLGVLAMDDPDEMFSTARILEDGKKWPTDDDSDPEDGGDTEDDDNDDDSDVDVLGTNLGLGDADSLDDPSNISGDDDGYDDEGDDMDSGDENNDDDEEGDFDVGGGLLEMMGGGDGDESGDTIESFSSGEDEGWLM